MIHRVRSQADLSKTACPRVALRVPGPATPPSALCGQPRPPCGCEKPDAFSAPSSPGLRSSCSAPRAVRSTTWHKRSPWRGARRSVSIACRLATASLAGRGLAPASALGHEAVAARASFEATTDEALDYFSPVSGTPGFPKALARTLLELRLAGVAAGPLMDLARSGPDLSALLDRLDALMAQAGATDRAALFAEATNTLAAPDAAWQPMPTLLFDVPFESAAEARFLWALVGQATQAFITVPDGDWRAIVELQQHQIPLDVIDQDGETDLTRLCRYLFDADPPPVREPTGELVWFSAPGEGRECVEIARRILKEAAAGVRFDAMAILLRSPQQYQGVLEHALARARIPAYFDRAH